MYAQVDFDPASADENELYGVDFVYDLARLATPGEQLISAAFNIGVVSGVDPAPASHLTGVPYVMINPFNVNDLTTLAVQRIQGLLPGVVYWLEAVGTSNNGNKLSLWSRIPVTNPPDIAYRK